MKLIEDLEYVSVAEMKAKLSEKLKSVESKGRRFAVTSHGKPKAVVISYKEYLAMAQGSIAEPPKEIELGEMKKEIKKRKSIIESVSSLFDENKLSRKGQKGYKCEKVSNMEKV
jgi:prevent-host-death family protein